MSAVVIIGFAVAVVLWWASTGAILVAVRLAERGGAKAGLRATVIGLPLLGLGAWAFLESLGMTSLTGVYLAFLGILALWGWVELSFLTGTVTGPHPEACPPHAPGWERLIRAWSTIAYHEIVLTILFAFVVLASLAAENMVGCWTYLILYFARISAKLNLFLGVRYINTEFLPRHLAHLGSHFRIAKMNWLFPLSVTALTFALAYWFERLSAATSQADQAGFALLAGLTALALLEHWLLVLPLPDAKLWRWMLPAPRHTSTTRQPEEKTS
ncbi:MAG: putative photosynthetic complex assembly protein PuhE [Pseudomonadota bacterium]